MATISIILRRPPYGSVDAPEAIRHSLGGATEDMEVNLILVDGGVTAARRGQDVSGTEYGSAEEGIRDCVDMGVKVFADRVSLREEHLEGPDIIEGVTTATGAEIADILRESDTVMIF